MRPETADFVAGHRFVRQIGKMEVRHVFLAMLAASGCGEGESGSGDNVPRSAVVASAPPQSLPPEIADAILDWSKCRSEKVVTLAQSPSSDEAVVDTALLECVAFERATVSLWEKHFGANSGGQVEDLRSRWRAALIANVGQMRAGKPLSGDDPSQRWGICVGQKLPISIPADSSPELIVDQAMKACSDELKDVRNDYVQRFGIADSSDYIEQLQLRIRRLGIATVEDRLASE